ncbi:MAG: efflux transporter outer membrane subunit, partial [Opitutales bacterium]|nr:efflux transporter outer membrane subunit [Opitutales bacterium]
FARVGQARALSDIASSGLWPALSVDPSVQRSRTSDTAGGVSRTQTSYSVPLELSYELDVWGRVRRLSESADANTKVSAAEFAVVLQTVQANVALNYFSLRALDTQTAMLTKSLGLYQRQAELVGKQVKAGLVPQTDLLQATTQAEITSGQLNEVRRLRINAEHALAVLTGRLPSELSLAPKPLTTEVPVVPAGLPSELLGRRPDVAAAEHRLIAANAGIGQAKADYYPRLTLTGSAGFSTIDASKVVDWQSRVWSAGPSLHLPLFQGGKLDASLEGAKQRYEESLADYRLAVLTAFRETEDVLNDLSNRVGAAESQARVVASARETARLVEMQYRSGLTPYYQLMDAQRTLLAAELAAAQIQNLRLNSTVALVKAIGGGWDPKAEPKR